MRRFALALLLLAVPATTVHTQDALTRNQRIEDLTQLAGFYANFRLNREDDPTGLKQLTQAIAPQSIEQFEKDWRKWVLSLRFE